MNVQNAEPTTCPNCHRKPAMSGRRFVVFPCGCRFIKTGDEWTEQYPCGEAIAPECAQVVAGSIRELAALTASMTGPFRIVAFGEGAL